MITPMEKKILQKIYYNVNHPAGYGSINALYDAAKIHIPKLKKKQVIEYLQMQDIYTSYKPVKKVFSRRKTIASHIDAIWQGDLVVLNQIKQENSNFSYILTCIDLVSRFAFAEPTRTKSPKDVVKAFDIIIKRSGRKPVKLHTDAGNEFKGKHAQSYFKENNIIHYTSFSDMKAAVCERFNKTLKTKMFKFFEKKASLRYVDNLQSMVNAYNNAPHRSLRYHSPSEVNEKNQKYFWRLQFPVKRNEKPVFKVGDYVRLSRYATVFRKSYLRSYTNELFIIHEIKHTIPICYKIKDMNGSIIHGIFYKQELSKYIPNNGKIQNI